MPLVKEATEDTVKNFLIVWVRVRSDFWKKLQRQVPTTLSDFYALVKSFKRAEEAMAGMRKYGHYSTPQKGRNKKRDMSPSPKKDKKDFNL